MGLVYISSTYEDLRRQRTAVREAVQRLEHVPIGMEDYQASEQRPLDRCLEDVRRCHAYIGVIGWRYGYVPPGEQKSITRLEYEAAGAKGIPRLIFMAPDDKWPEALRDGDPRTTEFRGALKRDHVINTFEGVDRLQYLVATSLKKQLGDGVVIPPLLPYRCDREEQFEELRAVIAGAVAGVAARSPLVFLVHGYENQALNKFIECVREDANSVLGAAPGTAVLWKNFSWPRERDPDVFEAALLRLVARELGSTERTKEALAAAVDAITAPLLIHSRVFVDDWGEESALTLRKFVNLWQSLPLDSGRWPRVVLITIEYREEDSLMRRFLADRRNKSVRRTVLSLAEGRAPARGLTLVPELESVGRYHAESWSDADPVQQLVNRSDLRPDIGRIFQSAEVIPMQTLAPKLLKALQKHVG